MAWLKNELAKLGSSLQEVLSAYTLLGNKIKTLEYEHCHCCPEKQTLSKKMTRLTVEEKRLHVELQGLYQSLTDMTLSHHAKHIRNEWLKKDLQEA